MNIIYYDPSLSFATQLMTINEGLCTDLDLPEGGIMMYNSATSSFNQLEVVVKANNIHFKSYPLSCNSVIPLTVVAHMSQAGMNDGTCRPYCGPLIRCNYVPDGRYNQIQDGSIFYDIARYVCDCPVLCMDFGVYVSSAAAQYASNSMQICSVHAKYLDQV